MSVVLDGKKLASEVKEKVKSEVLSMERKPGLAVVLIGNNAASAVYVKNKVKDCDDCDIACKDYYLSEDATQNEVLELISELNDDNSIDGILVQLPLPKQIEEKVVLKAISADKDVDSFHPENVGRLMQFDAVYKPCTPAGIVELLKHYNITMAGKKCVIVGRSNIVGKPMAMLMLQENCTVTICHSRTENLKEECLGADILIAAVGVENLITADMVKENAVVIDVAMNRNKEGKLCGDVDFANVEKKASYITPVPGGVGPMTRAMLMVNTLTAAKKHLENR